MEERLFRGGGGTTRGPSPCTIHSGEHAGPTHHFLEIDLWAAPSLKAPPRYYDGRKLAYAAMGPMGKLFENAFEEMKKIKGFPLSTAFILRTPMSRTETVSEAIEVRKGSIPASVFELPAGYRRKESPYAK